MDKINNFVDEITKRFDYSAMLANDLKRILPLMLDGKDEEKRQTLFNMLRETKIFVLPARAGVEDLKRCKDEVFGNSNNGVTFVDGDQGEYSKSELPAGSYISEPVFDDNMNIVGRNRMLFVKELYDWDPLNEVYKSNINLSHLIHEMGHAWVAEKNEYAQNEDKSFVEYVGAGSILHVVDKQTKTVQGLKAEGLFLEEALNTIQEESIILKLTGKSSIEELKNKGYVSSVYQGLIKSIVQSFVDKFGIDAFEGYRHSKDKGCIADIEKSLAATSAWATLGTKEYGDRKRKSIDCVDKLEVAESTKSKIKQFFKHYDDVYFGDNTRYTPIQKIDNVLEQIYNFGSIKYSFNLLENDNNLEIYKEVVSSMVAEANAIKNEAVVVTRSIPNTSTLTETLRAEVQDDKTVSEYYNQTPEETKTVDIKIKEDH